MDRNVKRSVTATGITDFWTLLSQLDAQVAKDLLEILREHLGAEFSIQTGTIIDRNGTVSDSFDLVVTKEPAVSLTIAFDKSEVHIPYDTVYAVADIRAFLRAEDVEDFSEKVERLRRNLKRPDTPADLIRQDRAYRLLTADLFCETHYRNPLFSFFFALASPTRAFPESWTQKSVEDSLVLAFLSSIYRQSRMPPSMIVVLDRFSTAPFWIKVTKEKTNWHSIGQIWAPEYVNFEDEPDSLEKHRWLMYNPASNVRVANYAMLLTTLTHHLRECTLTSAELADYLEINISAFDGFASLGPIGEEDDEEEG